MHGTINGLPRTSRMTWAGLGIILITLLADLTVAAVKFATAYISGSTANVGRRHSCRCSGSLIADLLLVTLMRVMPFDPLHPHFRRASAPPSVAREKAA